jgi:uncharacterized protein (TIGR00725 family)
MISVPQKPFIVGVIGSHEDDTTAIKKAYRIGGAIARRGHVLLTGGGTGLMKAASEGAHRAGGLVIGILPNERKRPIKDYPNKFVDIPIYTGMSDARNVINAKTPHVLIALKGGSGTLSEIALALKAGTPVIGLGCPLARAPEEGLFIAVETIEEVLGVMDRILEDKK